MLRLPNFSDRRREIDMVQTYKMINKSDSEIVFIRADTRRATRAAAGKDNLLKERSRPRVQKQIFRRVIEEWNNLPDSVKEAGSVAVINCLYRHHREGTVAPT